MEKHATVGLWDFHQEVRGATLAAETHANVLHPFQQLSYTLLVHQLVKQ